MKSSEANTVRVILIGALLLMCGSASFGRVSAKTLPDLVRISPVIVYGRIQSSAAASLNDRDRVSFETVQIVKGPASLIEKAISLCRLPQPMTDYPDISKWAGYELILFLSPRAEGCFQLSHSYVAVIEVHNGIAQTDRIENQPESQPSDVFQDKIRKEVARQEKISKTAK